jgi:hypothetical protein
VHEVVLQSKGVLHSNGDIVVLKCEVVMFATTNKGGATLNVVQFCRVFVL